MEDLAVELGTRLQVDKYSATVRYIGEVAGQEGIWVGLEWDNASRGKHNGYYKGHNYFSCFNNQTSGSFVRQNKLLAVADMGIDLTEALAGRYLGDAQEEARNVEDEDMYVQTASRRRRVQVELLGEEQIRDRQACLGLATHATLCSARVSSIGLPGVLRSIASKLQELSLAANLLPSWGEVSRLTEELPLLRSLDLSWNRMAFPSALWDGPGFAALRLLVLNYCCLTWDQVQCIEKALPTLEELCLCGNGLDRIAGTVKGFGRLEVLDLSNNAIRHWDAVRPLSQLPSLRSLILNDNEMVAIRTDSFSAETDFRQLECLLLGNNKLESWQSIDALAPFGRLKELRLSGNPLTPSCTKEERFEVIARLPHLRALNASAITPYERKESELQYMRAILGELHGLSGDSNTQAKLRAMHPRLTELQAKYGDTGAPAVAAALGPSALASNMLQLRLTCIASCAGSTTSVTKKLPRSMSLRKLKQLCERLFKLPTNNQTLSVRGQAGNSPPRGLGGNDEAFLGNFDLQDGAELLVMELDVEAAEQEVAAQHAALTAEHELRLSHQAKGMEILKAARDEQLAGTLTPTFP